MKVNECFMKIFEEDEGEGEEDEYIF